MFFLRAGERYIRDLPSYSCDDRVVRVRIIIITLGSSLRPHLHELLVRIPVVLAATHSASVKTEKLFLLAPLNWHNAFLHSDCGFRNTQRNNNNPEKPTYNCKATVILMHLLQKKAPKLNSCHLEMLKC